MQDTREEWVDAVLGDLRAEVLSAMEKHPPLNSPHEGYAVILEELDELWDEVKFNRGRGEPAQAKALQVGAMSVRYIVDVCLKKGHQTTKRGEP